MSRLAGGRNRDMSVPPADLLSIAAPIAWHHALFEEIQRWTNPLAPATDFFLALVFRPKLESAGCCEGSAINKPPNEP